MPTCISKAIDTYESTDDLIMIQNGFGTCVVCNKQSNRKGKSDLALHVETHMAGLSYKCKFFPNIVKSRAARNSHVYRKLSVNAIS